MHGEDRGEREGREEIHLHEQNFEVKPLPKTDVVYLELLAFECHISAYYCLHFPRLSCHNGLSVASSFGVKLHNAWTTFKD